MSTRINGKEMIQVADANEVGQAGSSRLVGAGCDYFFAKHNMGQEPLLDEIWERSGERAYLKRRGVAPKGAR